MASMCMPCLHVTSYLLQVCLVIAPQQSTHARRFVTLPKAMAAKRKVIETMEDLGVDLSPQLEVLQVLLMIHSLMQKRLAL